MAPRTPSVRHNLPPDPNPFIGREPYLEELRVLLREHRVVTLAGIGGIGKTRLAVHVAARAMSSYPEGVWLVELADVSGQERIFARIAAAVGIAEESDRELTETVRSALQPRRLLLVLDTCEHVINEVAAVAAGLLQSCPRVSLLLTSREPVRIGGEAVWRVPPLTVPSKASDESAESTTESEAVRLFLERARSVVQDFSLTPERLSVIADICRTLDGIPLGVELAAARIRVLSLAQIAERLNDRFRFLSADSRTVPARQQTLRTVVDWSHGLLTGPQQALLRRLSVFSGWDLEAAEAVCGSDAPAAPVERGEVLELTTALVDRSLVSLNGEDRGRARYRLLDTIRHYAAEQLRAAGEEEAFRERHRAYALALAERLARNTIRGHGIAWPERFEIWYRILAEYENLRAALRWSYERGETEYGLRFCVALRPYWMAAGQFAEGAYWTDLFLKAGTPDSRLRGQALVRRAELAFDCREHRFAAELGEEGLFLCREAGDEQSVALALNLLAMTDLRARDHVRAAARLAEVLALTRDAGDAWNEGIALGTRGALAAHTGDLQAARRDYDAALEVLRAIDHRWGVGRTLLGQGMVAEARGDLVRAEHCYHEALGLQRTIGAPPELARCLAGVGRVAARQGRLTDACIYLRESLSLSHGTGQRIGVARGLAALAEVAARQGRTETSHRLAGAGAALRERLALPAPPRPEPEEGMPPGRRPRAAECWEEGRELPVEQAVAVALQLCAEREAEPPEKKERTAAPATAAAGDGAAQGRPPLTGREREIALLVGKGLSNREIAEALFISPATAARHLANIHTKLGLHSRAQLAAWITRDGPEGGRSAEAGT